MIYLLKSKALFIYILSQLSEIFKDVIDGNGKWFLLIALLTLFGKLTDWFSKVPEAIKGLKVVRESLSFNNRDGAIVSNDEISEDKLMTVENPSGFYVKNYDNIDGLIEQIRREDEPIVSVVGAAGIGKTKLVQYVCTKRLKEDFKIQIYVDFEAVNSPIVEGPIKDTETVYEDAKNIFNRALGIERGDNYQKIAKYFQVPTIFFIDNYEQILDNKVLDRKIQSDIITTLTKQNPLIKVIITSREGVEGTNVFEVKELSNIKRQDIENFKGNFLDFDAIKLFCKIRNDDERKHRRNKSKPYQRKDFTTEEFKVIAELCDLVSNLPLGIRLIASRSVEADIFTIKKEIGYILKQDLKSDTGELSKRHKNLYSVFNWSFGSLTNDEMEFYRHLIYFQNGFFKKDIPAYPAFEGVLDTHYIIDKLYRKSFLREQEYPGASALRYEVYTLFKQLLDAQHNDTPLNAGYLQAIYSSYANRLSKMYNAISGETVVDMDRDKIKTDLRLEIENLEAFIVQIQDNDIDMAIDMLINLEKVLNEVGPYIILEKLFDPLLTKVKDPVQRAKLLMSKARVLKSTIHRDQCLVPIKEAIEILEAQQEVSPVLGEAYRIGAYLSSQISHYDLGNSIIEKFDNLSKDDQIKLGELNSAFIIQEKAKKYERDVDFAAAEACFDASIKKLENYKIQQAQLLNYSGLFYWRMGHSDKAEQQLKQAISQYKGIGEERWVLGFKTNLGLLYCEQDRLEWAMTETKQAYDILKHQGPYGWSLVNLQNKGRIIARYDRSKAHFEEAEQILLESTQKLHDVGYNESETLGYAELAELYYNYDHYDNALFNAQKCLKLAKASKLDKWMRAFRAWCILGLVQYKQGDIESSRESLQEANRLSISVKNNQWLTYKVTRVRYNELCTIHRNPLIPYPWTTFLSTQQHFYLFGYGSLINQYSSSETIKGDTSLQPVMGYGVKRVLNYDPDERVRSRPLYQDPDRGDDYFGAFNLDYTGSFKNAVNGVIRKVTQKDFESFVAREVGYALVKIQCQEFGNTDAPLIEAYTLVAPQEYNGRQLVNDNLLPNVPYYKICREGAAEVSDDFLKVWLDTSFLGDGRNVKEWEQAEGLVF